MVSRKPEQPLVCPEIRQAKKCLHQNNAVSVGRNSFPMMNEKLFCECKPRRVGIEPFILQQRLAGL